MSRAVIFDCEFLTAEGAMRRNWCGYTDPDPLLVQIGAVSLLLTGDFEIDDTFRTYVAPRDRDGSPCPLDPFFTDLTGITEATLAEHGLPLSEALLQFERFAADAPFWSWGKDELNGIAVSCYVAGLAPPFPATRFGNAAGLLVKAGMPPGDVLTTMSNRLAAYHGLSLPEGTRAHDALDDAMSVAVTLRHFLRSGALRPADLLPAD